MIVQAFIPDWNSRTCNAVGLQNTLMPYCEATILSAYDVPFAHQWEEALDRFDGDVMLYAMADGRPQFFGNAFPEMVRLMSHPAVGAWAPELAGPSQMCTIITEQYEPKVYSVTGLNMVFVAIKAQLINALPKVPVHRRGWLLDYLLTAVGRNMGLKMLCDTRFIATHPEGSAYSTKEAEEEAHNWLRTLPGDLPVAVERLWRGRL